MTKKMQNLIAAAKREFLSDADDHLDAMENAAADFQNSPADSLAAILRGCHNLKGAAQASGLQDISAMFHAIESVCQFLQAHVGNLPSGATTHLEKASDLLRAIIIEAKTCIATLDGLAFGDSDPSKDHWRGSVQELLNWTTSESKKTAVQSTEIEGFHLFDDEEVAAPVSNDWGMGSGAPTVPTPVQIPPQVVATGSKARVTKSQNHSSQYLLFTRLTQTYAMPVSEVKEIIAARPVKPLPMARAGLGGVVTIGGMVLPLVEPTDTLGPCSEDGGPYSCMIICDKDEHAFALKVDRVSQVLRVDQSQLKEAPNQGLGSSPSYVKGIAEIEGKTVLFIETKEFVAA